MLPHLWSFTTRGVPHDEVVDRWRQAHREAYVPVRADPLATGFQAEIRLARYEGFGLSTKRAGAEVVRRSRRDIGRGRDDRELLYLLFPLRSTVAVEQLGRTALARPGSVVVYDSAIPFTLHAPDPYEHVVLELPAETAFRAAGTSRGEDLLARTFHSDGAVGSIVAFFVDLARSQGSDPAGTLRLAPQARALATSLVGLLSPAAGERPSPEVDRRRAALAFMRAHLADPELDAERIAAAVHLSKRSLFRLFEETDTTVMGQLRSLRLEHARTMLRTHPGRPISAIAAGAGFSGPVPFHRAFRETEGMTPGEYRDLVAGRVEPRAVSADADG